MIGRMRDASGLRCTAVDSVITHRFDPLSWPDELEAAAAINRLPDYAIVSSMLVVASRCIYEIESATAAAAFKPENDRDRFAGTVNSQLPRPVTGATSRWRAYHLQI